MVLSGVALLAASWRVIPQSRTPEKPTNSGYVDPAICAGCHQDIAKTYLITGMGRSLYRPTAANTVEDYQTRNTVHNDASRLTYTMVERDGEFYQRRSGQGFGGQGNTV